MSKDRLKKTETPEVRFEEAKERVLFLLEHPLLPQTIKIVEEPLRLARILNDHDFVQSMPDYLRSEGSILIRNAEGIALPKSPWNPIDRILVRKLILEKDYTDKHAKTDYHLEEVLIEESMHLFCNERQIKTPKGDLVWRGFSPNYYIGNPEPVLGNTLQMAQEEARCAIAKTLLIFLDYSHTKKIASSEITPEEGFRMACRLFYKDLRETDLFMFYHDKYPVFFFIPEYLSGTTNLKGKIEILFESLYSNSYEEFLSFLDKFDRKNVNRQTKAIFESLVHWCYLYNITLKKDKEKIEIALPALEEIRETLIASRKIFKKQSYWIEGIK